MANVQALQRQGWYLTVEVINEYTDSGRSSVDDIIRAALDLDLKDIAERHLPDGITKNKVAHVDGPFVLQIQKIRNVSAPKENEESQAAPKMFKMTLTDGHGTCVGIEVENINKLGLSTPPGTKVKLLGQVPVNQGFLLLNNSNCKVLGGRVDKLVENWELKRALAKQSRGNVGSDGGPPAFIPFGQRRREEQAKVQTYSKRDNFKSLESSKEKKEDTEFEQQRQAVIDKALQAKDGARSKNFGSAGQKQVNDKDVAKIADMGFSADHAAQALKDNNNNVQEAINALLRFDYSTSRGGYGNDSRSFGGHEGPPSGGRGRGRDMKDQREPREPRGRGGRRGREEEEGFEDMPSKPSAPATLFDFLTKKIPSQKEGKAGPVKEENKDQPHTESRSRNTSESESSAKRGPQNLPPRLLKQQQEREKERQRNVSGRDSGRPATREPSPPPPERPPQTSRSQQGQGRGPSSSAKQYDQNQEQTSHRSDDFRGQRQNDFKNPREDFRAQRHGDVRNQRSDDYRSQRHNDYRNQRQEDYRGHRSDDYRNHKADDYRDHRSDDYRSQRSEDYRGHRSSDDYRGQRSDDHRGQRSSRGHPYGGHDYDSRQKDNKDSRRMHYESQNRGNISGQNRQLWGQEGGKNHRNESDNQDDRHRRSSGGLSRNQDQGGKRPNYQNHRDYGNREYNNSKTNTSQGHSQRDVNSSPGDRGQGRKTANTESAKDSSTTSGYGSRQHDHHERGSSKYHESSTYSHTNKTHTSSQQSVNNTQPPVSQSKPGAASLAGPSVVVATSTKACPPQTSQPEPVISTATVPIQRTTSMPETSHTTTNGSGYTQGMIQQVSQYDYQVGSATSHPMILSSQSQMTLNGDTAIISVQQARPLQAVMAPAQQPAAAQPYNIPPQVVQQFQGIQITGPPPVQSFSVATGLPAGLPTGSSATPQGSQAYIQQAYSGINVSDSVPTSSVTYNSRQKYSVAKQTEGVRSTRVWKAGEYCAAKYYPEDKFYRAVIQNPTPSGQSCFVIFPDYGNVEEVSITDIRTVPYPAWEANNIQSPGIPQAMAVSQSTLATMPVPVTLGAGPGSMPGLVVQSSPAMPFVSAFTTDQPYQGPVSTIEFHQGAGGIAFQSTSHVAMTTANHKGQHQTIAQ